MNNNPLKCLKMSVLSFLLAALFHQVNGNSDILEEPTSSEGSRVEYLDNGIVRIGIDLSIGGAITYFADKEKGINMVNSHDWGRQIQMSFYSGPKPFEPNGKKPKSNWAQLGWNPIQSGDCYGNQSKVIDYSNDGKTLYVKCIPMHWPLDNAPGQCTFETWIKLEGSAAIVRSRINNHRDDKTQYTARSQEVPAIYTNGPWYRLITYSGDKPFTGEAWMEIPIKKKSPGVFPWSRFQATENWTALVDKDGHGLGVWTHGTSKYLGGFAGGKPGAGGPKDNPTGYISPINDEIIDHNIQYEYTYQLISGTIGEIRDYVYERTSGPVTEWEFTSDRQHWIFRNAHDTGWPIQGALTLLLDQSNPQVLSPIGCWQAKEIDYVEITAAFSSTGNQAKLNVLPMDESASPNMVSFRINPDGKMRTYKVKLNRANTPESIKQFVLLPSRKGSESSIQLKRVKLGK